MSLTPQKIVLWQLHDGKPGHQNQLRGLTHALAEFVPLEVHSLRAPSRGDALASLWLKKFPRDDSLPTPDLILGAGHSTHLAVLAARRAHGSKAIVLMKPSLPSALFDLCIIPAHDRVAETENIIATRGALNVIRPTNHHEQQSGLMLIGGPSKAHGWSNQRMLEQIAAIASGDSRVQWQLTTSRRTPTSFLQELLQRNAPNLHITPHQETNAAWVPQQLQQASQVWVSEDSVSMIYEALTSGAAVGALEVPCKRRGRVSAGVDALIESGWATRFADWLPGSRLNSPPAQLDEARRCAEIVSQRFLLNKAA